MDKRPEDKAMQLTYSLGMVIAIVLCILIFFRLLYLFLSKTNKKPIKNRN